LCIDLKGVANSLSKKSIMIDEFITRKENSLGESTVQNKWRKDDRKDSYEDMKKSAEHHEKDKVKGWESVYDIEMSIEDLRKGTAAIEKQIKDNEKRTEDIEKMSESWKRTLEESKKRSEDWKRMSEELKQSTEETKKEIEEMKKKNEELRKENEEMKRKQTSKVDLERRVEDLKQSVVLQKIMDHLVEKRDEL